MQPRLYRNELITASNTQKHTYSRSPQPREIARKEKREQTMFTGIARSNVGPSPAQKTLGPSARYELIVVDQVERKGCGVRFEREVVVDEGK